MFADHPLRSDLARTRCTRTSSPGALGLRPLPERTPTAARLTDRAIRTIIAKRAVNAGIEGRVSGHSLRVGSAQSLAAAGAGVVDMQVAGRWESERMPARYARGQLAGRGAIERLRYGA